MTVVSCYYLACTPGNVVSIVRTGRAPDNQVEKLINLYPHFITALSKCPEMCKSKPVPRQAFILQIKVSDAIDLAFISKVKMQNGYEYLQTQQIKMEWIQSAHLCNETSSKLFNKLLNDSCSFPIHVGEKMFDDACKQILLHASSKPKLVVSSSRLKVAETSVKQDSAATASVAQDSPAAANSINSCQAAAIQLAPMVQPTIRIVEKQGDLLGSRMQTLVNTVNCVGVMGKGIALAFKQQYPVMFEHYQALCKTGQVKIGKPYLYRVSSERNIINFPTKNHWKNASKLEWIQEGLECLSKQIKALNITSIALPPLGCGNGGLNWANVRPLVYKYLSPLPIEIEIYLPFSSEASNKKRKPSSKEDTPKSLSPKEECSASQPLLKKQKIIKAE